MIGLGVIFLLCVLLSAFFSGAEMAFVSGNKVKLRELADSGQRSAKSALSLHDHPQQFLTVILMGNNIVNITATVILTYAIKIKFGIESEWLIMAIMAPLLLIFAEMVPKDYCRLRSQHFLLRYSFILHQLSRLFYYPTLILIKGVDFLLAPLGTRRHKSIFVSETEFRSLIDESTQSGVVTHHEKRLIDTILDFERIRVDSVMIPVSKVPRVSITGTVGQVKAMARRTHSKMVLVYEEIPSIIVGMIYVFDLLFEEREDLGLKNYLRSPIFLPRSTSIEKAFLTLQERRQSFAIITDVRGEVVGAVPIENLFIF